MTDAFVSGESKIRRVFDSPLTLLPPSRRHRPLDLAVRLRLFFRLAFVEILLAACDGQFHLGEAVLEIHPQRNQRKAALRRPSGELGDLAAVQQQLAWRSEERRVGQESRDL